MVDCSFLFCVKIRFENIREKFFSPFEGKVAIGNEKAFDMNGKQAERLFRCLLREFFKEISLIYVKAL